MDANKDQLSQSQSAAYKQAVLSLIGAAMDRYPLPPHLEYMVSIKNRLSPTPGVMYSIVTKKAEVTSEDVLAFIEIELPFQLDITDGVRWVENEVRQGRFDLREALQPEDMLPPLADKSICPRCKERPIHEEHGHNYKLCLPCFTASA